MDRNKLLTQLTDIVGEKNIVTEENDLLLYIFNAGPKAQQAEFHSKHLPMVAVQPATASEVSQILRIANENNLPVLPRGQASGLAENTRINKEKTIILSTVRFKKLEIEPETLTATVGAGVITADIKKAAAKYGLFYPPDPASFAYATIGGNIATDSGGLQCVKYGTTRSYVAGLEVVLANGEIIHTGNKCIKDVAGYNLTQLFAGSEGTLGVITEAILKLVPLPEGKKAMMAIFDDLESAGKAVSKIMVAGVVPSTMELLENTIIRCVEDVIHQNLPVDAAALLLIEVDGDAATLDDKIEKISAVCKELGVGELRFANTAEEINQIWEGRRNCMLAVSRFGKRISGDPAAPINRLPEELLKLRELGEKYNVKTACYGHAGDGNLHPLFFYNNDEEFERATKVKDDFYDFMLTVGGTVTAEHGIGNEKIKYMKKQFGPAMYGIMKGIKKVLDPKNILSPGCLFGEDL